MPPTSEDHHFYRLVTLSLKISPIVLRRVIKQFCDVHGLAFDQLLNIYKHELFHYHGNHPCCQCNGRTLRGIIQDHQWQILFKDISATLPSTDPHHGHDKRRCPLQYGVHAGVTVDVCDVSLACSLIINIAGTIKSHAGTSDSTVIGLHTSTNLPGLTLNIAGLLEYVIDQHIAKIGGLQSLLASHLHVLFHAMKTQQCCQCGSNKESKGKISVTEWNAMYCKSGPPCNPGVCSCQYTVQHSITHAGLSTRLIHTIGQNLGPLVSLRSVRNEIAHSMTGTLDNIKFRELWNRLSVNLNDLIDISHDPTWTADMRSQILDLETCHIDGQMWDEYRSSLQEFIQEFGEYQAKIRQRMDNLETNQQQIGQRMDNLESALQESRQQTAQHTTTIGSLASNLQQQELLAVEQREVTAALALDVEQQAVTIAELRSTITSQEQCITQEEHSFMALSKETVNYTRCCYVAVEIFPEILRHILQKDIPPHHIKVRASGLRNLTAEEKSLLRDASSQGYSNFDVTFLYKIIRNINLPSVTAPSNGWGKLPTTSSNNTIGDIIERIRDLRNKVYGHAHSSKITDNDFNQHWSEFSDICQCVDSLFPSSRPTFVSLLGDIKKTDFNGGMHRKIIETVHRHIRQENQIKELSEQIDVTGQQMDTLKSTLQENQRQNCQRMDNLESTLQENQRQNFEQREVTATLASNIQQKGQKIEVLDSEIKQLQLQASDQKVTTDNLASDVQQQEERIAEIQSVTRSRQTGILAWIRCCTNPQQPGITQGKGKLRQDLVKIYHKEEECISVSPLDDQNLTLEQIYSPVIVEEDLSKEGTKPRKSGNQQIKKTEDIFYNNGKLVERVFMKGEAGKGKTVFGIKLLHDWCRIQEGFYGCDMHKVLSLFELTFFVSLRHVKQGITNIVDMICDSLPSKHSDMIRHVLSDENTRCLIILDGLDEWSCPSHYDDKFPDSRDLDNCVLFNTTRPWKLEKLRLLYTSLDKVVEIQGLNPKCIKNVIKRVVTYLYDKHDTDEDSDDDDEISQATSRTDRDNLQETDIDDSELNIESDSDDDSEISSDSKSDGNIHVNFQNITRRVFRKFIKNPRERAKKIDVTFPEDFRRRLNVFIKKVRSPSMESLMSIPMMLTASCHVWYENNKKKRGKKKDVMASMTYFSLAIIDILIKRSKSKEDIKHYLQQRKRGSTSTSTTTNMTPLISRFFPNIVDLMEIIMPFCKLAYNDLLAKETHLVFEREHLEREMGDTTVDLALKVGFISQCKAPGSFHVQNVSVSFFHKLIQEIMAAIYIIRSPDGLQTLCDQCPSLDKVLDLSNVFMYVSGLDSSVGCVLSQHVARVTETDHVIALYRQEMREGCDKVRRLYHSHLTCYREMVHVSSMMGIPHPPPYHISDVYLDTCDSEVVREIMSNTHHTVVSVWLWSVPDVSGVIRYLPQHSQTLTALCIMDCDVQSGERLVTVFPLLVHLQCVWYEGNNRDVDAGVVAALTRLTRLKYVQLRYITLGNTPLCVSHMTQLETLGLLRVYMTAGGWGELVSDLLSIPHKVKVTLEDTDIDADSITRILSSPQVTAIYHDPYSGGSTWRLVFYNKT